MIVLLAIRRALGRWSFFRHRFNHKTEPLARSSRSEPIAPRKPGTPDSTQSTQSFRSTASNRPKSHALSSNPPDIEARPPLPRTNSTARRELKNKISNPQFNGASNLVDDAPVKEKRKGRVWSMASIASLAAASDYYAPEDDDMAITPCSIPTILVDVEKESMRRSSLNLTQPCQRQSILIVGLKSEQRAKRGRSIKRVSWFDGQDGELDDVAEEEEKHTRFESPEANSRNTLCSLAEWEEVDESEVMDWEGMDFVRAAVMSNGKANGARRGSLPDYDTRRMSVFPESRRLSLVSEA